MVKMDDVPVQSTALWRRSLQRRESDYRPYWDPARETRPVPERNALILRRLQHQVNYAYEKMPFYRRLYDEHGFHPDMLKTLDDFTHRVPIVTKKMLVADQKDNPPFGSYLGVDREELARVHGSSGTSGVPTLYGISRDDWNRCAEVGRIALWSAGIRPDDIVQISFPFGLFLGGWGLLHACESLGACACPVGSLMSTDQQIAFIRQLEVDALMATPSYALHLARRARELGIASAELPLGVIVVAGEPGGSVQSFRQTLSETFGGADVIDLGAGASSEMHPFYANVGCRHIDGGVHLIQDENFTEVVDRCDPNAGAPVGTAGAIVSTHLWRRSQPMIRFWVNDEAILDDSPCPCGRTFPRLPRGVYGRLDDMLLIRGVNVYPSAIDSVIRETSGGDGEYRVIVERVGQMDELIIEIEQCADAQSSAPIGAALKDRLEQRFKDVLMLRTAVRVVEPGTYDVQTFKSRRVIDRRE